MKIIREISFLFMLSEKKSFIFQQKVDTLNVFWYALRVDLSQVPVTSVSYCCLLLASSLVKMIYFVTDFLYICSVPFHPLLSEIHGEELRNFICLLITEDEGKKAKH